LQEWRKNIRFCALKSHQIAANSHLKVLGEKRQIAIAASLYSFMIIETSKIFNASIKT
jgi:hypothetical protein